MSTIKTSRIMLRGVIVLIFIASWVSMSLATKPKDQKTADSLEQLLDSSLPDSLRTSYLNQLGRYYVFKNRDRSLAFVEQAMELAKKSDNVLQQAGSHNTLGIINERAGQYDKALKNYHEALSLFKQLGDAYGEASGLSNIGVVYYYLDNYDEARKYFQEGLEIRERLGDISDIAGSLNNIAIIYYSKEDYDQALEYYGRSLALREEQGVAKDIAESINNMGAVYEAKGSFSLAIAYYQRALAMWEEEGNMEEIARAYFNIAEAHLGQNKEEEAIAFLLKGVAIADSIEAQSLLMDLHKDLSLAYVELADHEKAYLNYKKYAEVKDALFNEDKSKEIGKLEAKYEFEKAEEERTRIEKEELAQAEEEKSRRDVLQYSGILMVLVVLGVGLLAMGKLSIPVRLAEGMVFFTFLLFFEFLLVLLDPYIERYSGGEPAYKLLFNAVLAGMIFPLHSFFEGRMKYRFVK